MFNVFKFIFIFFFILNINQVFASYSIYDYDASYTPYNLQAAIDHGNCDDEIEQFDEKYQEIRERWIEYVDGTWAQENTGGLASSFEAAERAELDAIEKAFITNDLESENAIAECLSSTPTAAEEWAEIEKEEEREEEREEEVRKALASCDIEVLENLSDAEEHEYEDKLEICLEARDAEILAAVAVCDFDFFENEMTRKEWNFWFTARKNCEENPPIVISEPEPVKVLPVSEPEQIVVNSEPVYVEPVTAPVYVPELIQTQEPVEVVVANEEVVATTTEATTTEELIEVTKEELDRMVEERINEKLNEIETEPKTSFFKRVTNFLFGWLF